MTSTDLDRLCASVSADEMMGNLRKLAGWIKLSGSPAEAESLDFVAGRMRDYGYRTTMLRHPAYISLPGAARVETDAGPLACITQSFSRPSGPSGLTGTLVHVGRGTAVDFARQDVAGRIVLVDGMATPPVADRASRAGAIGQLHINADDHLHEMCISPVWGSPSAETKDRLPSTVVVTIGREDGAGLRARVQAGESVSVTLHAEVDTGWRDTPILVAELDGPDASDDAPFVMFSGHHDTWHHGVMDNGAANCTMMEVARLMAPHQAAWRRGLRFCFWSGHSHGRYSGSTWYADTHWDELERRCVVHVNTDSTGGQGATLLTNTGCSAELWGLAREAIAAQGGQDYAGKRTGRQADQSFFGIGIPSVFNSLSHQPPHADPARHMPLGWWWHTPEDTIDKIDPDNLVRDTRVFVHTVWRLLTDAVLPIDYAEQARCLRTELQTMAAKIRTQLPLERLLAQTEALEQAARSLAATPDAARANAALMAAGRALVPMDYTRGDRFTPDPAVPLPAWPVLQPLRDLAEVAPDSDEVGFRRVSALRAANRVSHALREAIVALRGAI